MSKNSNNINETNFPSLKTNNKLIAISKEKKRDVKSMIPWCPSVDKFFQETLAIKSVINN